MTVTNLSEAELLRLMAAGDEDAFAVLYRKHQGAVFRFALLMSGSAGIAEEVTQEVFLTLMREPSRFDTTRGTLPAFLHGVARNQVLRLLKRERPYLPLVPAAEDATEAARSVAREDPFRECTRNETIELVRQTVLSLPARYREVIVLCDFQELSLADAAVALNCPVGTVNSRLNRGHALLLRKLCALSEQDSNAHKTQALRCFA